MQEHPRGAAHLEGDIVGEHNLLALLHLLLDVLLAHKLHAVGAAGLQLRPVRVPLAVVLVLHREGLHLEADDARQVRLWIPVIQDGESQVVVYVQSAVLLHMRSQTVTLMKLCMTQLSLGVSLRTPGSRDTRW